MWKVSARNADGIWEDQTTVVEIFTDGPFRSSSALAAARQAQVPSHLMAYLAAEAEPLGPSRDAIETWAATAQEESEAFDWTGAPRIKAIEEAVALFPFDDDPSVASGKPLTLAWHDHTAVLIPIKTAGDIRVEYVPDPAEEHRIERLRFRYATDENTLETVFDWRGYFGTNSAVFDGWAMMRQSGRGYTASFVGAGGFVVGTVLRRLTKPAATLKQDPTARRRRIDMESKYPQIASGYPDLSEINPARHERSVIFIHGTLSCGIVGLKDLFPAPADRPVTGSVFRFEHDTFHTLDRNAQDLVTLVRERLVTNHLLLVAHSRGGLVAKLAADLLRKSGYQAEVSVYTFGTPHLGTPLIAIGTKILNLLFKLGEDFATNAPLPLLGLVTKAYSYTVDVPTLPPGINAMHENGGDVRLLQLLVNPVGARSWSSHFDIKGQQSGFGVATEGVLLGALKGRPHDLVVPADSAAAFGVSEPVLLCSHVKYFLEPIVRSAITEFLAPAMTPTAVLPLADSAQPQIDPAPKPEQSTSEARIAKLKADYPKKDPVVRE